MKKLLFLISVFVLSNFGLCFLNIQKFKDDFSSLFQDNPDGHAIYELEQQESVNDTDSKQTPIKRFIDAGIFKSVNLHQMSGSDTATLLLSDSPSESPSESPTDAPTDNPTTEPFTDVTFVPTASPTDAPIVLPTLNPTSQPSSQPSSQPVGRPSSQPIGRPSAQPTGRPTSHPSSHPSSQPVGRPTSQPSGRPTAKPAAPVATASPILNPPTLAPVVTTSPPITAPPTHTPTLSITTPSPVAPDSPSSPILTFSSNITLTNVRSSTLSSKDKAAVINSTAISMAIAPKYVSITGQIPLSSTSSAAIISGSNSKNHNHHLRGLAVSYSIKVITETKVPLVVYGVTNSTQFYNQLVNALKTAVDTKTYNLILQQIATATGASNLLNATATNVSSSSPTVFAGIPLPDDSNDHDFWTTPVIIGIVVGGTAFIILLTAAVYYVYYYYYLHRPPKRMGGRLPEDRQPSPPLSPSSVVIRGPYGVRKQQSHQTRENEEAIFGDDTQPHNNNNNSNNTNSSNRNNGNIQTNQPLVALDIFDDDFTIEQEFGLERHYQKVSKKDGTKSSASSVSSRFRFEGKNPLSSPRRQSSVSNNTKLTTTLEEVNYSPPPARQLAPTLIEDETLHLNDDSVVVIEHKRNDPISLPRQPVGIISLADKSVAEQLRKTTTSSSYSPSQQTVIDRSDLGGPRTAYHGPTVRNKLKSTAEPTESVELGIDPFSSTPLPPPPLNTVKKTGSTDPPPINNNNNNSYNNQNNNNTTMNNHVMIVRTSHSEETLGLGNDEIHSGVSQTKSGLNRRIPFPSSSAAAGSASVMERDNEDAMIPPPPAPNPSSPPPRSQTHPSSNNNTNNTCRSSNSQNPPVQHHPSPPSSPFDRSESTESPRGRLSRHWFSTRENSKAVYHQSLTRTEENHDLKKEDEEDEEEEGKVTMRL